MSHAWTYKAGIVPVNPAMEEGAKSPAQERTNFRSKRWADHVGPPHPSPPLSPQGDGNTRRHPAAPMETVVGKHQSPSQQRCHGICPGAEHVSGDFTNRPPADFRVQSPTDVSSLFSSQASSRESLFSDGWDRERSWSAMQLSGVTSPLSLSRAVSPCSSVRSGAFTPTVVRVRRHALASGSSMLHLPQASCQSSCESLASSAGAPRSPPPPPRRHHRPPLTRLSLLTAILRKGRLPVLSPALQRPYSPCWPINHITLASCTACSAASGLAPVSPRSALSPSPGRKEGLAEPPQSRWDWDSFRQRPALPLVHIPDGRGSGPRLPETASSDRSCRTGKGPMFQTVFSRPVTSPTALRATGGEQGVPLGARSVPLPPLQSAAPQLNAVPAKGADLTRPNEGTESTRLPPSRPCWYSGATSPGPKGGANQTVPGSSADKPEQTSPAKLNQPQTAASGNVWARRVCSPSPLPATARLDCISPPPRSLQSCLKKHQPFTSHSHQPPKYPKTKSPAPGNTPAPGPIPVDSPRVTTSPAPPRSSCLSPSRYAPVVFSGWPSPSRSHTSTPDRFTLTPSPASLARDLTPCPSPCPSPSLRSTPSPRPGSRGSEYTDREGRKRKPHKIKSSYKSLAAIPTNTLLLDQQVIDKQVEADEPRGAGGVEDPHAEMCSPAQLRQESEELYAVIDKILDDGVPKTKVSPLLAQPSRESNHVVTGLKQTQPNSLARPMGRETKYATVSSPTPSSLERILSETQTKPGVIRPMLAAPRRRVEECAGENQCNPFARYLVDTPAAPSSASQITTLGRNKEYGGLGSKSPAGTEGGSLEDVGTTSALFIMESADRRPHPVKPASWQGASATFSRAGVLPEVSETRI